MADQLSFKAKKKLRMKQRHLPYVGAVVNCLSSFDNMVKILKMSPEQIAALIAEARIVAMDMRDALDVDRPFCDRVIATAVRRLNERAQNLQETKGDATIAAS